MIKFMNRHVVAFRSKLVTGILVGLTMFSNATYAHETFLLPAKKDWAVSELIEVSMASALSYPDLTWGIDKSRVAKSFVKLGNSDISDVIFVDGKTFLNIKFTANNTGAGLVAVSTKKRAGAIKHEDTEGYLDEIGASDAVRQAFRALPGNPSLERSYVKHAKTFFCVDSCQNNSAKITPVGQALEFVLNSRNGNVFQLLSHGKPLAKHDVRVKTSDKKSFQVKTDDQGLVSLDSNVHGQVMLSAVAITLPSKANGVYHSDYATLVLSLSH